MLSSRSDVLVLSCFFVFTVGSSACGGLPPDLLREPGSGSQEIRNGIETNARPEVGIVHSFFGLCTGTLIAPNLVLTAAHCVHDERPSDLTFEVGFSGGAAEHVIDVRDFRYTDGFTAVGNPSKPDLALLLLKSSVPNIQPAQLATSGIANGTVVDVYGFGDNESDSGAGIKRTGQMQVSGFRSGTATLPNGSSYPSQNIDFAPAGNNQVICPGDSGGPVFDPQGKLVGVNSYGSYYYDRGNRCTDFVGAGAASVPHSLAHLNAWAEMLVGSHSSPGAPAAPSAPGACKQTNAKFQNTATGCQDVRTGRIWSSRLAGRKQPNAKQACLNLQEAGVSDWRLPTKNELVQLAKNKGESSLNGVGTRFYWSKSKQGGQGVAIQVKTGKLKKFSSNKKLPLYCVRN